MKRVVLLSLIASSMLMAGGYKIPETSLNGVALGAANIAHNKSADAAYYNPANMVFMEDKNHMELDLTYIGLEQINFKGSSTTSLGTTTNNVDINSKSESFLVPTVHYVSGKAGETRIGLSITSPGGLSKRWDEQPAMGKAEEFTLKIIEINPTVAIPINDKVAVAFGFRIVHSEGVVKATPALNVAYQDMTGDSIDYGYNLALAYKPTSELEMAFTYRSQVNLTEDGTADLKYPSPSINGSYDTSVNIPLPAFASLALAYTLPSKTTIEFVYERNMWSAYKELNFEYTDATAEAVFGTAKPKNWKDTNTFRLGITQELDSMTLMAGMVYDETPVPDETISYELPDSNSFSVSLGGRYQVNDKVEVGLAALYSMRQSRSVNNENANDTVTGEFSNGNVLMISTGITYKF
ncbi:OmpP1/FadL family transporter [Sulfurimonas sp. CS5]|uniref:OmpP1/FadL family transporter n=1 Tax=Sulfurimonas sp. CS5 TaxID=3391145 RepID=UPI0039EB5CDF